MEANIINEPEFILKLNKEEALWLRALMQNPIGVEYEDEDPQDKKMRATFFSAVEGAIIV